MSTQLVASKTGSRRLLSQLLGSGKSSILPFLPASVRYFLVFLLLLNYKAFPLVWHFQMAHSYVAMKLKGAQHWFDHFNRRRYMEQISPVGQSPFDMVITYQTTVGFSDTDFNAHLSNSAYAKNLDFARLKAAVTCFPSVLEAKGWLGLGDSHYHFLKEIPMFTPYEIRISIGGWDSKWLYVVAQFVTYPKKKSGQEKKALVEERASAQLPTKPLDLVEDAEGPSDFGCLSQLPDRRPAKKFFLPPAGRRGSFASSSSSSSTSSSSCSDSSFDEDDPANNIFDDDDLPSGTSTAASSPPSSSPPKLAQSLPSSPTTSQSRIPPTPSPNHTQRRGLFPKIPEGAVLHSTHVSSYVFKHGRITIPPRVALVASGFGDPAMGRWERLQELRNTREVRHFEGRQKEKGELGGLQSILAGGWKQYEGEGLWDLPEYEEMRYRGVEEVGCLRSRMDGYYTATD